MRKAQLIGCMAITSIFLIAGCSGSVETGPVPSITPRPSLAATPTPEPTPEPTKVPEGTVVERKDYKALYEETGTLPNLSSIYKERFTIGLEVVKEDIEDEKRQALVKGQFNTLSLREDLLPENIMDYEASSTSGDTTKVVLDFTNADVILQFAKDNGFPVRSSALISDSVPSWFFTPNFSKDEIITTINEDGEEEEQVTLASKDVILKRMENYITSVISHCNEKFPGVIISWDVLENAVYREDAIEKYYRNNYFLQTIGEEYMLKAFSIAKKASDGTQKLFYSEDKLDETLTRNAVIAVIKLLQTEGNLDGVEVIGDFTFQAPNIILIEDMMKALTNEKVEIHIKKFYINSKSNSSDDTEKTKEECLERAAKRYKNLFAWLKKMDEQEKYCFESITFEGLTEETSPFNEKVEYVDSETGETVFGVQIPSYPYLFDEELKPRDNYFGAVQDPTIKAY